MFNITLKPIIVNIFSEIYFIFFLFAYNIYIICFWQAPISLKKRLLPVVSGAEPLCAL